MSRINFLITSPHVELETSLVLDSQFTQKEYCCGVIGALFEQLGIDFAHFNPISQEILFIVFQCSGSWVAY